MSKTTVKLASSGWSREVKRTKGGIDDGRQFLAQLTLVSVEETSVYVVLFDVRLPVIEFCKFQKDALRTAHAVKLKV